MGAAEMKDRCEMGMTAQHFYLQVNWVNCFKYRGVAVYADIR